jgi:thiol-disulfide isomerase/thioredoxin
MSILRSVILYAGLALCANTAQAEMAQLEALRSGDMEKLVFLAAPAEVPQTPFTDIDGAEHTLSQFQGKYVLVNFWATWCAPCRKEMPMLSALQSEFGGDNFEVVTIATGRNSVPGIQKFFAEIGVSNLPLYLDPKQQLARDMAILGLPISIILDPEGREIARMRGDATWDGDSAKAIIAALISGG